MSQPTVTLDRETAARIESALMTAERLALGEYMNSDGVVNIMRDALARLRAAESTNHG